MPARTIKESLLYAGLSQEEYKSIVSDMREENSKNRDLFAPLAAALFFILFMVSAVTDTFASPNKIAYGAMLAFCLAMWSINAARPTVKFVTSGAIDYAFCALLYAFSLWITFLHAQYPAVTAVVVVVIIPLLFVMRPLGLVVMTVVDLTVFCILSVALKSPDVAATDVWNALTFGLVAVAIALFVVRVRIRSLLQKREINRLWNHDVLTGVKNRNCFEREVDDLAGTAQSHVGIVYADANGLHELNNTEGHERGDALLKCVAAIMREEFGENVYRIGGDEFVAVLIDESEAYARCGIAMARRKIERDCFSASFGYSYGKIPCDVPEIMKKAEREMFECKFEHYCGNGKDRRTSCRI